MHPLQSDANRKIDAALVRAVQILHKNRCFVDAFYLGRIQLERGSQSGGELPGFIRNAHEAGLLSECAEFLVALANERPDDVDLLNYTAGLLGEMGQRRQSRDFARMAAARKPFFPSSAKNAKLRVLALQCIATADYRYSPLAGRFFLPGITSLHTILDPGIAVHRLLVDDLPAALKAAKNLPKCDIVFNAISDPDYEDSLQNAATLCDALELPVFNHPHRVRGTNRTSLPTALQGKSDTLMAAKSVYLPPDRAKNSDILLAIENSHLEFPVILRAPGFQGGHQMALVGGYGEIEERGGDLYRGNGVYILEFVDVSFQDSRAAGHLFYPKYRAFFVDGQLFPIHFFASDQYEVHKKTSDPVRVRHPWLSDMETDFLQAPDRHLPKGLWDELKAAMSSFGMDYFGVDFAAATRPKDCGKLVLFECNAVMANRIALLPEGSLMQRQWREVTLAAHVALCKKSGVAAWPFALKKGLIFSPEDCAQ